MTRLDQFCDFLAYSHKGLIHGTMNPICIAN